MSDKAVKSAYYDKNFKDYEILKPRSIEDHVIVKGKEECDLIGREIKDLVFADCTKSFDEILAQGPQDGEIFKFDDIKIKDEVIKNLKIVIKGYDESNDNLKFDLDKLSLSAPYRYALSNEGFEMNIFLNEEPKRVLEFLATFEYDYKKEEARVRHIFVFVNENMIYEKIYK